MSVCLELDVGLEVLEKDETLEEEVSSEVAVRELELKEVLVGQVLGKVHSFFLLTGRVHVVLCWVSRYACSTIDTTF